MYSVIHAVVLDPFPKKDTDHLMSVHIQDAGQRSNGSYYTIDEFLEIAERNPVFETNDCIHLRRDLVRGRRPTRLRGNHCTMNTFTVMGIAPLIGCVTGVP